MTHFKWVTFLLVFRAAANRVRSGSLQGHVACLRGGSFYLEAFLGKFIFRRACFLRLLLLLRGASRTPRGKVLLFRIIRLKHIRARPFELKMLRLARAGFLSQEGSRRVDTLGMASCDVITPTVLMLPFL